MSSRLNSAQPQLGAGYELDAIAAAVIGGNSLTGGGGKYYRNRNRSADYQLPDKRTSYHAGVF